MPISNVHNIDCMEFMRGCKDKEFSLAICDVPYGIGAENHGGQKKNGWNQWDKKDWDSEIPPPIYFTELKRISRNQIMWGGNYLTEFLPPSQGWVVWDKGQRDFSLADAELAWTSFDRALRVFDLSRGVANMEKKVHPTQKPIALYQWLLKNYAKEGDTILDTHLGSGSSRIAADKMGFDFTGCELDVQYFKAHEKRWKDYKGQLVLEF